MTAPFYSQELGEIEKIRKAKGISKRELESILYANFGTPNFINVMEKRSSAFEELKEILKNISMPKGREGRIMTKKKTLGAIDNPLKSTLESLRANPAEMFITKPSGGQEQAAADPAEEQLEPLPEGFKYNPEYKAKFFEKRTRRVNLVFQPSLFEKVRKAAANNGMSINDYIHKALEELTKGE